MWAGAADVDRLARSRGLQDLLSTRVRQNVT